MNEQKAAQQRAAGTEVLGHECCWHPLSSEYSILQPGHLLLRCCKCPATKTQHADHWLADYDRGLR